MARVKGEGHIVVFKRPSESNLAFCTEALGMKISSGKKQSIRAGVSVLTHKRKRSTMYTKLGVMHADLDNDAIGVMSKSDEVEMVVKNQIRSIPVPVDASGRDEDGSDAQDAAIAYLQGMRDAADLALRFMQGEARIELPAPAPSLTAAGGVVGGDYPLGLIGMDASYRRFTGLGVPVAVLDTGIDLSHPDFAGRVAENDNAESFVDGESVQDGHGHGTHCAGTVAGPFQTNGARRFGVAPDVQLLVAKVLGDDGSGDDFGIIDGIDWAHQMGARIISMSLGSSRGAGESSDPAYERIARNLLDDRDNGSLIIAAAGNDSARPRFVAPVNDPAAAASIMAVGAVGRRGRVAPYSCGQRDDLGEVNVTAPGTAIYSTWTGGGYRSISGTSMATPHIAGIAALYLEREPDLSPSALWRLIESSAQRVGRLEDYGAGIGQAP